MKRHIRNAAFTLVGAYIAAAVCAASLICLAVDSAAEAFSYDEEDEA